MKSGYRVNVRISGSEVDSEYTYKRGNMNPIQTWNLFQFPDRKIGVLAYRLQLLLPALDNLQEIKSELNDLNNCRRIIQKEIIASSKAADVCGNVCFICCNTERSSYNHFSSVDYLLRMFSDQPVEGYEEMQKPEPFFVFLIKKIIGRFKIEFGKNHATAGKNSKLNCPNLTKSGCEFLPEDRPIACIVFTCSRLRQAIPEDDLLKMGKLTKELVRLPIQLERMISD